MASRSRIFAYRRCATRTICRSSAISASRRILPPTAPPPEHRATAGLIVMNSEAPSWKVERDADRIAWLTLDKPGGSANVLSKHVLVELGQLLERFEVEPPRALVIRSGKPSGFIAGADIKEFTSLRNASDGYALIRAGQQV